LIQKPLLHTRLHAAQDVLFVAVVHLLQQFEGKPTAWVGREREERWKGIGKETERKGNGKETERKSNKDVRVSTDGE
jgi:hypothetical protein